MAETCRSHGFWMGYLYLCRELQQRTEAFSTICHLDDISLLEDPEGKSKIFPLHQQKKNPVKEVNYAAVVMAFWSFPGVEPQTLDEWKLLIQLSQLHSSEVDSEQVNGSSWSNGSENSGRKVNPESLTLMLARTAGPDPAIGVLEECGVQPVLSPASKLVFELLRVTEKRQRWVGGTK